MREFMKSFRKKQGMKKRVLSMLMVLTMIVSLIQALPGNLLTVKAAEGVKNITVHYQNFWGWETPSIQFWGGTGTTVTGAASEAQEISGWGGAQGYVLSKDETTGFYSVTLTGDFGGFQFLDLEVNEEGKHNLLNEIYSSYMDQYTGETPQDLYYLATDADNDGTVDFWKWYTDAEGTTELAAPADAKKYDVTLHWYNADKWETTYAWVWNSNNLTGGNWPGQQMTATEGKEGWFEISFTDIEEKNLNFIFSDGNGTQTRNLNVALSEDVQDVWTTGGKDNPIVATTAPTLWTDPSATPDDGDEEGTDKDDDSDVTDKSSGTVTDLVQVKIGEQNVDMQLYMNGIYETKATFAAGTHTVTLVRNGVATETKTSFTLEEEKEVYLRLQNGVLKNSVTEGIIHTAALTGNFNGLEFVDENGTRFDIASWAPADVNAELTYYGGGLYGRTFQFNALAEDVEIADTGYKVAFDDGWDYSIGQDGGNIEVTIPAGSTSLTIFVDEINQKVYDDVRTADFETIHNGGNVARSPFTTTVSFIGDARQSNEDWSAAATGYEFTQISDTLFIYQKVFNKGTYNYKCVFDYSNWYEAEGAGNRGITITEDATNVVFIYDTVSQKLYDTVNNASEVAVKLGMQAAPAEMEVVDNANGTTKFVALAEDGSTVNLYYATKADAKEGNWTAKAMKKAGDGVFSSGDIFLGDDVLDLVYYYDIDGTKKLDGSNPTVTVAGADYSNYTREVFEGRGVNVPGTFPGPSWNPSSNKMTYQGNGLYKYTFTDVPAANYEFKIAMGSWAENYGANAAPDGGNCAVKVTEKQDVSVYYNDFSHRAVTSIDYIFADIDLIGTNIPEGTKLTDDGLSGIYSATVVLTAGTYSDVKIKDNTSEKEYSFSEFVLTETKEVTFYFDPATGIKYHNASDVALETENIYFDSKDSNYKSVFGAVATGEEVTFTLDTGVDAVEALFVVKGVEKKALSMNKDGDAVDGVQKWSVTTSFNTIGENNYYFAVSNGSSVKIYADDDGYYGKGEVTELTSVTPYDLVVYKAGYETPDWMKDAVIYQIFPDRFFDGDESNNQAQTSARGEVDYEYIRDWYTLPENPEQEALLDEETYKSTGAHFGDGNWSNEIYGGDLEGITERIDYLKALGVNVIYLNPVFSSISSHRYDTSDYYKIDPILGDLGDFKELVRVAEENDMHVVLDGVFNHVSDDSIYFDRYYKFLGTSEKVGAYPYWAYVYDMMAEDGVSQENAEEAAKAYFTETYGITDYSYVEWFDVFTTSLKDDNGEAVTDEIGLRAGKAVYGYDGWWGYDSMPIIKSTNGSEFQTGDWAEEIIYSDDKSSVTQYWITQGMDGWRLDVANEVSDETWQEFRESVKALDSDAVIIGEIWDDATEYLLGDMYDSVMNYVFRGAVTGFAKGGSSVDAMNTLEKIRERYPEEAFYAMMNLVGSHDTTRILSYLDGISDDRKETDLASAFPTYEGTSDLAKQRQYLVAFLQFTYAGAPTIYYGDEIGMVGSDDPDDRRAFEWGKGNKELVTWYATLAEIRDNYTALRTGSVEAFEVMKEDGAVNENLVAYVRRDEKDTLIVVANNAQSEQEITLDLAKLNVTADELTELVSEKKVEISGTSVTVTVPALSGVILTEDAKKMSVNQEALAPAYDEKFVVAERTGEYKPETPSNPGTPSNPEAPSTPDTPSNPEQPSTPDTPGTSDTPSAPSQDDNNSSNQQIVGNVVQNTENNVYKEEIITQGNRRYRKISTNGNAIELLADEAIIPAGAKIKSVAVAAGSATYNKATQAISEQLTNTGNFVVFDIDLTTGNNVQIHELNGYVSVTMSVPENLTTADGRRIVVYRLEDDGTLTRCETTVENGMVTFVTNHFSTYIFIEEAIGAVNTGDNMAGILLLAILMLAMGAVLVRVSVVRMKK